MTVYFAQVIEKDGAVVQALTQRRQVILDNVRDNDESGTSYQKVKVKIQCPQLLILKSTTASMSDQEIEANEKQRRQLQGMIDEAIGSDGNRTYLNILSQYRLLVSSHSKINFL